MAGMDGEERPDKGGNGKSVESKRARIGDPAVVNGESGLSVVERPGVATNAAFLWVVAGSGHCSFGGPGLLVLEG